MNLSNHSVVHAIDVFSENERLEKEHDDKPSVRLQLHLENDGVYLEKYIRNPRHIQFKVNKYENIVHFGERDYSIKKHPHLH
uniref:Carbamoyl phosphate synthase ATP-binding domain-containing protein n=1 Tax=Lactuca sativa TaxID=4236 RepID=A0A9R1VFE2_LACSA|nr:hypothetical protein LSAT_V11C500248640 [Lactuca sativa]